MLFIGTEFSILYTSMHSQPRLRLRVLGICGFVLVCTQAFMGFFWPMSAWLISPPSSGTLAFSLRLVPFLPAADFPAFARVTRLSQRHTLSTH